MWVFPGGFNKILSINAPELTESSNVPGFYEILIDVFKNVPPKRGLPMLGFPFINKASQSELVDQLKGSSGEDRCDPLNFALMGIWGFGIGPGFILTVMTETSKREEPPRGSIPKMLEPKAAVLINKNPVVETVSESGKVTEESPISPEGSQMRAPERKYPVKTNPPCLEGAPCHQKNIKHRTETPPISKISEIEHRQPSHPRSERILKTEPHLSEDKVVNFTSVVQDSSHRRGHHRISSKGVSVDRVRIIEQIIQKAKVLVKEGRSEITVQLHPEHLGSVKIKVKMENSTISARFQVDNPEVKQLIEANLPRLKETLDHQGLRIDEFDVFAGEEFGSTSEESERRWNLNGRREPCFSDYPEEPELQEENMEIERYYTIELIA